MAGLVLEGGSFRGIFSAGVMDALLDHNIHFNYVIGVSAGISNGTSYISRQKKRNIEIMRKFRNDNRYMSMRNIFRCRSLFGLDFIFDEIPNQLVPFDWETYLNYEGIVKVGITDALTGEIVYKDGKSIDKDCSVFRATCAIPIYFPAITVDGRSFYDGGLSDSIPIKQSIADGNKRNLVILTQPKNFVKEQTKSAKAAAFIYRNKYPALSRTMNCRHEVYNETIQFIEHLENHSPEDIVVLQPSYSLNSFEKNVDTLEQTYNHGYEVGAKNIERIASLFEM